MAQTVSGDQCRETERLEEPRVPGGLLPGVGVMVVTNIKARQTAAEMMEQELQRIEEPKPAFFIWQTGAVDAIKGVDPEELRETGDQGSAMLQTDGVDVVLMSIQYSPRSAAEIR